MQFEDHRVYAWLALALMIVAMMLTGLIGARASACRCSRSAGRGGGPRPPGSGRCVEAQGFTLSGAMAARSAASTRWCCWCYAAAVFGMLVAAQALSFAMFAAWARFGAGDRCVVRCR